MNRVSRVVNSAQYTGANAAEILEMCEQITYYSGNVWTVGSDDGQTLVMRETAPTGQFADWPVQLGEWVIVAPDVGIVDRITDQLYDVSYKSTTVEIGGVVSDLLESVLGSIDVARYGGFGASSITNLNAGATSAGIIVDIYPDQPDAAFHAEALAFNAAGRLSQVEIISITVNDLNNVTVVVKNNGGTQISGTLLVHVTPIVGGP